MVQWRTVQLLMYLMVVMSTVVVLGFVQWFTNEFDSSADIIATARNYFGEPESTSTLIPTTVPAGQAVSLPRYPAVSIPRDIKPIFAPAA